MSLTYRPAVPGDVPFIQAMLRQLAEAEEAPGTVTATQAEMTDLLFGLSPCAEAIILLDGSKQPLGIAIFYIQPATYRARRMLYIEDLVIDHRFRGRGWGRAAMALLARIAQNRQCFRLCWSALEVNQPALGFYDHLNAPVESGRLHYHVEDTALSALAGQSEKHRQEAGNG